MSLSDATKAALAETKSLPLLDQLASQNPELASSVSELADAVAADIAAAAQKASTTASSSASAGGSSSAVSSSSAPSPNLVSASFSPFVCLPDISCMTPRGKHDIELSERTVVFRPKSAAAGSATLEVPRHTMSGVFHLVTKEHQYLILSLNEPVTIGKAQHHVLAIQEGSEALRKSAAAAAKKNATGSGFSIPLKRAVQEASFKDAAAFTAVYKPGLMGSGSGTIEAENSIVALKALLSALVGKVGETDLNLFKSFSGNTYFKAYVGANDGFMFPLRKAFVFVGKPLLVLPHADVSAADVGRAGES
jgi:Histone chaperone Rttp106-like